METFNNYFVNTGLNRATFQNYIHNDGSCLGTINLTDLKLGDGFVSLKTNKVLGMMIYLPIFEKSIR